MERGNMINREQFFQAADACANGALPTEDVEIEGLGTIRVKALMLGEFERLNESTQGGKGFRAALIVACCVDERGAQVFQSDDAPRFDTVLGYLVSPIVSAAIRVNKLGIEDAEKLRKN